MEKTRKKLLYEIDQVSFAVVEMNEYLDTHPYEEEGIQYFKHLNEKRKKLMEEYAKRFEPLCMSDVDQTSCDKSWDWALTPFPWKGGCY